MYTKKIAKNGKEMFFKNGKITSVKNIPQEELVNLGVNVEDLTIDQTKVNAPLLTQGPICIFDGVPATTSKYINGITAPLCDEHYKTRTTGEIAEQVRNNNDIND